MTIADWKPAARIKATAEQWDEIRRHFEHACCVACGLRHQHLHHIAFKKADRGDDVIPNLAPICNACHQRFHSRSEGWERVAAAIRNYVYAMPTRFVYVTEKMGERFHRRYPPIDVRCANPYCLKVHSGGPCATSLDDEAFMTRNRDDFLPPFNPEDIPFV